jgi:hypothetical protein
LEKKSFDMFLRLRSDKKTDNTEKKQQTEKVGGAAGSNGRR